MKISSTPVNLGRNISNVADKTVDEVRNASETAAATALPKPSALVYRDSYECKAVDGIGPKQTLAAQWADKMALVERGRSSTEPKVREAAGTLRQHFIAQQKELLADAVYRDSTTPAPVGWKDISHDAKALAAYGLKPDDFRIGDTTFRARMFAPDPNVFGDVMKPTLVFKGTTSSVDNKNNFQQGINVHSDYYERAVHIGNQIKASGNASGMDIAGHSLGGGLASAASAASGSTAYSFNAAGLNSATVSRYGGVEQNPDIFAYHVKTEILNGIQNTLPLAEAKGNPIVLPPAPGTQRTVVNPIWQDSYYPGFSGETERGTLSGALLNHRTVSIRSSLQELINQSEAALLRGLGE